MSDQTDEALVVDKVKTAVYLGNRLGRPLIGPMVRSGVRLARGKPEKEGTMRKLLVLLTPLLVLSLIIGAVGCDEERFASLMGQTQGRVLWYCQTPQPENPYA